jgi:hypothetical protein
MGNELGPLVVLQKGARMNGTRYRDTVLEPAFLPFYRRMKRKFGARVLAQEDNAKYHTGAIATAF